MLKKTVVLLLLICSSCSTTSIISSAINNNQSISISITKYENAIAELTNSYTAYIKKNDAEYEFQLILKEETIRYKLPANKLALLKEMENSFKELDHHISAIYFLATIESNNKKRSYKLNTDIIKDFIGGLKKK